MNNLISVFMNYKINRLTEYGVFAVKKNTDFVHQTFRGYFQTYVDNYYYGIFNTIDEEKYNDKNLKLEFKGIMEEMLDEYRAYELQVSNQEYDDGRKMIQEFNSISYELLKIDHLEFQDKEDISVKVFDFIEKSSCLKKLLEGRESQFVRLVRETYTTCSKLLSYKDNYYDLGYRHFYKNDGLEFLRLTPSIKTLDVYRRNMVEKIYLDERLDKEKVKCCIQKISLEILKKTLKKEKIPFYFLEFGYGTIIRGNFEKEILSYIDNPLFRKYVVITVPYNLYLSQKNAFQEDYLFACIQDYSHINDIYQKTENIVNEGVFQYLIVSDYKYRDRDFFLRYEGNAIKVLLFEEE